MFYKSFILNRHVLEFLLRSNSKDLSYIVGLFFRSFLYVKDIKIRPNMELFSVFSFHLLLMLFKYKE